MLTNSSYKPAGYTPNADYYMTNTQKIAGNVSMPHPTSTGVNVMGNTGP